MERQKEEVKFLDLFNNGKADLNKLQLLVPAEMSNYFSDQNIRVLDRKVQYGLGLRGTYTGDPKE